MSKVAWVGLVVVMIVVGVGAGLVYVLKNKPTPSPVPETVVVASPSPVAAVVNNDLIKTQTNSKGDFLTDPKGITLYTYDKDTPNISNCYAGCAKAWPPYLQKQPTPTSTILPADFDTTKRTDGKVMYTYKGWPLYYYTKDVSPGDVTGDGVEEIWHLAKP